MKYIIIFSLLLMTGCKTIEDLHKEKNHAVKSVCDDIFGKQRRNTKSYKKCLVSSLQTEAQIEDTNSNRGFYIWIILTVFIWQLKGFLP